MKVLLAFICLIGFSLHAQQLPYKKLREIKLQSKADRISVDRLGGFYIVNACGIDQFDPDGKPQKKYHPRGCTDTELVEAWSLMRIYAYQKSKQQFIVFDSNMEIVEFLDIDPAFAVEPQLATPSYDLKHYWILDIDNSIKKIDLNTDQVILESEDLKDVKGKITHMREYQNFLFLLDSNSGIYIVNKLGKLVSKIEVPNIQYFSFAGEDLYYLKGNQLFFYDIFSKDTYFIAVPDGNQFAIATDERLILIKDQLVEIFQFTPKK